jgi:hypothetical protein
MCSSSTTTTSSSSRAKRKKSCAPGAEQVQPAQASHNNII